MFLARGADSAPSCGVSMAEHGDDSALRNTLVHVTQAIRVLDVGSLTRRRALTSLESVNARRVSSWLLIAVTVFVVFGHVCALPVHVHAGAVTTHAEDHPEHGDEASHGGSCEALRASPSVALPALPAVRLDIALLIALPAEVAALPVGASESPPLFLLHAVLRI
jgi:hypothetical protein